MITTVLNLENSGDMWRRKRSGEDGKKNFIKSLPNLVCRTGKLGWGDAN